MTLKKIEKTLGLKINFLEYNRVKTLVNKKWKNGGGVFKKGLHVKNLLFTKRNKKDF